MSTYRPDRVISDLRDLAARTGGPDGSRRLCWTPDWLAARAMLRESLTTLPVDVDTDEAGNLWAVLRGERPEMLVVGSHLDSVPKGGWLDGALGVMAGLELLRTLAADGPPPVTVALVDWADEEGARFSRSLFGSAACVGTLDLDVLRGLTDKEGAKLPEVLAEHGVDIEHLDGARTRMADVKAYVEVHIEQGPILEDKGLGICAVTGTKGIERERLIFRGQAAHAGTMPMAMRRDSFRAAARFALAIAEIGERHDGVTTVGHAQCWPGVVTAVAGETRITMDMRHIDADGLQAMFGDAHRAADESAAAEGCTVEWEHIFRIPPMPFHPALLDAARTSVREVEGHDVELPSGALHDASEMAREVPTVMIFSSSIAGLSHTKEENTPDEHLTMAADAFERTCRRAMDLIVGGALADLARLRPMSRRTRLLLMAAGGLTLWFGLSLVLWAFQPLTDSVPVGLNADGVPVSQEVQCNTLFESTPRDEPLPVVAEPMKYEREPCVQVHHEARVLFGIDAGLYALGMVLITAIGVRGRRAQRAAIPAFG